MSGRLATGADAIDQDELALLATELGVQSWYSDTQGRRHDASAETLVAVLRSLGAPVHDRRDLAALHEFVEAERIRPVDPVVVAQVGQPVELDIRTPAVGGAERVVVHVRPDGGDPLRFEAVLDDLPDLGRRSGAGRAHTVRRLRVDLGPTVGSGYHAVTVELGGGLHPTTLINAPTQVPHPEPDDRRWGVFAALYGCRPADVFGPNVNDLARIGDGISEAGGGVVATLPILATYLTEPFEPSPYAPVSQRYWNELYLDISATPELAASERARRLLEDPATRQAAEELRTATRFDHRRRYALVRPVLDELAATCFTGPASRRAAFDAWASARPDATRYATFRAATDRTGTGWRSWGLGPGRLPDDAAGTREAATHLWAQWTMGTQLAAVAAHLEAQEQRLYLDLPVGTHADGFDTWSQHDLFAWGAAVGAPPDDFFAAGQNWGFPPVSPIASRAQGHSHLAACIRHHLSVAGVLRLDHVMGFHRLYWVPEGMTAPDGAYVRYPSKELFAVLAVEAARGGAYVVGEDLGTVPDEVREELDRYAIGGMYVSQFELPAGPGQPIPAPAAAQVASLDTHDTPTFAAWWQAEDISLRRQLDLIDDEQAADDRDQRGVDRDAVAQALDDQGLLPADAEDAEDERSVLSALVALMGASDAATVLVAADDLVLETEPQNVPGTGSDRPNWVQMLPGTLSELFADPRTEALLARLQRSRRRRRQGAPAGVPEET